MSDCHTVGPSSPAKGPSSPAAGGRVLRPMGPSSPADGAEFSGGRVLRGAEFSGAEFSTGPTSPDTIGSPAMACIQYDLRMPWRMFVITILFELNYKF